MPTVGIRDSSFVAQNVDVLHDGTSHVGIVSTDSLRPTYRVAANFTPQPTGAVTLVSVQGSATKTVRIKRVLVSGVSTALSSSTFKLVKTSALGAGGTIVTPTVAKLDSGSAAATAVVKHYTTSLKAAGTPLDGDLTFWQQYTTTVTTPTVAWSEAQCAFPEKGAPVGQAIVLRGTAEFLEIQNSTPANLAAGTVLAYMVEWEEDDS